MKKSLVIVSILAIVLILLPSFSLVKLSDRNVTYTLPKSLREEIKMEIQSCTNEFDIKDYSIRKTADMLTFTKANNINNGKANCIGYAQLCSAIYNYCSKVKGYNTSAKPVYGYVYYGSINLNSILLKCTNNNPFVKDHDFVEFRIEFSTETAIIYEDPCMYDFMGKTGYTIIFI